MKLVIDIPEEIRVNITRMGLHRIPDEQIRAVDAAVQNGAPLPEGHGKLIDRELKKLRDHNKNLCDSCTTKDCIFQYGIVRTSCDFYSAKGRWTGMTIDETKYLMEALEEVNERDRIVKCNTIDRVLDILDRYYLWHLDENGNYVTVGEEIKAAVLALKGEQE